MVKKFLPKHFLCWKALPNNFHKINISKLRYEKAKAMVENIKLIKLFCSKMKKMSSIFANSEKQC